MTLTLFYSFLSGFGELFGFFPVYLWEILENFTEEKSPAIRLAVYAGLLNGLLLVIHKLQPGKKEIGQSLGYGLLAMVAYFLMPTIDLRTGGAIALISAALILINNRSSKELVQRKLFWGGLAIASVIPFLPVALIVVSVIPQQMTLKRQVIRRWLLIQVPTFIAVVWFSGQGFLKDSSSGGSGFAISLVYLAACLGVFVGILFLLYLSSPKNFGWLRKVLVLIACLVLYYTSRHGNIPSEEKTYAHSFSSMGTVCEVTIRSSEGPASEKYLQESQRIFELVESHLSTYRSESEISRLNKDAFSKAHQCSDILWQNLMVAEAAWKLSNGAFDVTIGPLVKLWGIKRQRKELPTAAEIAAAKEKVGFDKLIIDRQNRTVKFSVEGLKIDFGGLTKGWAVDRVRDMLYQQGVTKGLINLGGNIYCLNGPPEKRASYAVGIKNPLKPGEVHMVVNLLGQGVATSGNYEQFIIIDGKRYTHIIDPRTGMPVNIADGVTVISDSATWCDVLSTAIFIEGQLLIEKLRAENPQLNIWFVKKNAAGEVINKTYGPVWDGVENGPLDE